MTLAMFSPHSPIAEIKVHVIDGYNAQAIQIDLYNQSQERLAQLNISESWKPTRTTITSRIFTYIYDFEMDVVFANLVSTYLMNHGPNLSHLGLMDCLIFSAPDIPVTFQSDTFSNTLENPVPHQVYGKDS